MAEGIEEEHPKLKPVQKALDTCDQAFVQDNWPAFQRTFETIRQLTKDVVKPPKPAQRDEGVRLHLKTGDRVVYRTPRIRTGFDHDWVECLGTVHMIDEDWQMVLVIPETEQEPWRWVASCYVQKETS